MRAIDTNVLVRCLVDDNAEQARRARSLLGSGSVYVSLTVLLEAEWVLRDAMEIPAAEVISGLERFCGLDTVVLASDSVVQGAFAGARAGLDFADALHLAQATGCDDFVTFDKAFAKRARRQGGVPVVLA
jgi:predicted nucleic-acid-binding protein